MTGTDEVAHRAEADRADGAAAATGSGSGGTTPGVRIGWAVAVVLAAIPALRMVGVVLDSSIMQHSDYWMMAERFLTEGGSLDVAGLFHFQNEHPVVFAQLAYWVNTELFAGSNRTLGLFVVGLVVVQLVVVWRMLARSTFSPVGQMALLVTSSALLFGLSGAWNFSKSMSGAAWLTANLFAVVAVWARTRDRQGWALVAAALSAMSYGTGTVAWIAVAATGACRRPLREVWREWPAAVGFVATLVWYRLAIDDRELTPTPDLWTTGRALSATFALPLGLEGGAAELVGLLPLVGVPLLVGWAWWTAGREERAPWVGLATFGWVAAVLISYGRSFTYELFGAPSRYSSLAALAWIGLLPLSVLAVRALAGRVLGSRRSTERPTGAAALVAGPVLVVVLALPLVVGSVTAGGDEVDALLEDNARQQAREVALHLGIADGTSYVVGPLGSPIQITDRLRAAGHWPFVGDWDRDCGLLGETLGETTGDPDAGRLLFGASPADLPEGVQLVGVVTAPDVRCVVITDGAGEVVGAAGISDGLAPDIAPPGLRDGDGFVAVALAGRDRYEAFVVFEDDPTPVRLGGQVRSDLLIAPG